MRLGVLPSSGGSLTGLERTGQLSRFVDNYLRAYGEAFEEVLYFSYRNEDYDLPPGVRLVQPGRIPSKLVGLLMPVTRGAEMRRCDVFRIMQAPGAHPAILARWLHGIPYVTTFGYDYSGVLKVDGASSLRVRAMHLRERLACRYADALIQPSPMVRDRIIQLHSAGKMVNIPNAVDVDNFHPAADPPEEAFPIFVGRLMPVKNLSTVLQALAGLERPRFRVIGDGPLREELLQQAAELRVSLEHEAIIPNEKLPDEFRRAGVFVMASHLEGMPKVLLEAMACGCACLGNDTRGIADFITHGETGLLFDGSVEDCREKFRQLLTDRDLRRRLGRNARHYILEHFNITEQLQREIRLLEAVAARGRRRFGVPREAPAFE